jgi:hypothetical protein
MDEVSTSLLNGNIKNNMRIIKYFQIALIICLLFCSTAWSQELRELRGIIRDESGSVLAGVEVTLQSDQGQIFTVRTDSQGRYSFSKVPIGSYVLNAYVEGFEVNTANIDLSSSRTQSQDVTLKVVINDQVEIKSDSSLLSTSPESNLSATTLSEKDLKALPDDPDELLQTLREMAGPSAGRDEATLFIDGFRGGRLPPKEAILSVRINSNPFSAEFSEPGNSRIEVITKPGSDQYHGNFRFNFNDESLNGRNAASAVRPPLQVRNYNGTFTGPIIRNRLGVTFNFDRREQDENEFINATALNPVTLTPQSIITAVNTPTRASNLSIGVDYLLSPKQTLGVQYRYNTNDSLNQGLQSGFDLPERAFSSNITEKGLRVALTSVISAQAVNELRVELIRRDTLSQAVTDRPAVIVLDAFSSGGNQPALFSDNRNDTLEISDSYSYTYKKHSIKAGVRFFGTSLENVNRANFRGTFTFGSDFDRDATGTPRRDASGQFISISALEHFRRTVLGLPGYRPSQFSIAVGDPFIGFSQTELATFIQDDWRISPKLTLSYGLRQELQNHLEDKFNLAPRIGLAFAPDKAHKSAIRAGIGVFYTRLDPSITFETTRLDGIRQRQVIILNPDFFATIPNNIGSNTQRPSTIRTKDNDLRDPYTIMFTASYERQISNFFLSTSYSFQRGVHLLRTRNINAPQLVTGLRPFNNQGPILQYETTGISKRHELRITARNNFNRFFSFFGNYTLSSTRGDTDGPGTSPANPFNLESEFGRLSFDQRHQVFIGSSVNLPYGLRISQFMFATSGRPFNITTGRDNNSDTVFSDRPAFAQPGDTQIIKTKFGDFNPNPGPGARIIPRNSGQGPGQFNLSTTLSKNFGFGLIPQTNNDRRGNNRNNQSSGLSNAGPVTVTGASGSGSAPTGGGGRRGGFGGFGNLINERYRYNLTFSISARNIINRNNRQGFNGVLSSPFFGQANRSAAPRRIEFSLSFNF